jgi:hypothetical protein
MTLARIALGGTASAALQSAAARIGRHHQTHQRPPLSQRGAMRRCTQRTGTSPALRVFDGHGSLTLKFCAQSGINNQFAFLAIEKDGEDVLLLKLSTSECRIFIHAPHPTGELLRNSSISCPRRPRSRLRSRPRHIGTAIIQAAPGSVTCMGRHQRGATRCPRGGRRRLRWCAAGVLD